ncbi:unnamed protein product [Bursaphelenchus okinawaensis]|uniref:Phytanoyl-CoA hydroxylase-interacting protein-like C-terminal domain-containing protein n=1 Tax=Bursaphelenchus okinawaensis TaxID=465554 RepID=A0A811JQW4_9BILA|nr:unnamed protein product [Bursaphelenchus okinawaensis]CAG9078006.1 unnamed protein product [Bursaphelenchus okinawaensis]
MYYDGNNTNGRRFVQQGPPRPMGPRPMPMLRPLGPRMYHPGPMMGFRPQYPPAFDAPMFRSYMPNYGFNRFETPSASMLENQRSCIGENRPDDFKRYDCFEDFSAKDYLKLDVDVSSEFCTVKWWPISKLSLLEYQYKYEVYVKGNIVKSEIFSSDINTVTLKTEPGREYKFMLFLIKKSTGKTALDGSIDFKAVYKPSEIDALFELAKRFIGQSPLQNFTELYRCKPRHYFDEIIMNRNRIMEKYIKDDNGHSASPINGKLRGLFFSAEKVDGKLPNSSPFGDVRITIPADQLIKPHFVNLYFVDFYCNSKPHYVTVVVCQKGSNPDEFCKRHTKPMELATNPFFRIVPKKEGEPGPDYYYFVSNAVHVEICYTENVPLSMGTITEVMPFGRGSSRIGGLRNNVACQICNIPTPAETPRENLKLTSEEEKVLEEAKESGNLDGNEPVARNSSSSEQAEVETLAKPQPDQLNFPRRQDRSIFGFLPPESVIRQLQRENTVRNGAVNAEMNDAVLKCVFSLVEKTANDLESYPAAMKLLDEHAGNQNSSQHFLTLVNNLRTVVLNHQQREKLVLDVAQNPAMKSYLKRYNTLRNEDLNAKRPRFDVVVDERNLMVDLEAEKEEVKKDDEVTAMFDKYYEMNETMTGNDGEEKMDVELEVDEHGLRPVDKSKEKKGQDEGKKGEDDGKEGQNEGKSDKNEDKVDVKENKVDDKAQKIDDKEKKVPENEGKSDYNDEPWSKRAENKEKQPQNYQLEPMDYEELTLADETSSAFNSPARSKNVEETLEDIFRDLDENSQTFMASYGENKEGTPTYFGIQEAAASYGEYKERRGGENEATESYEQEKEIYQGEDPDKTLTELEIDEKGDESQGEDGQKGPEEAQGSVRGQQDEFEEAQGVAEEAQAQGGQMDVEEAQVQVSQGEVEEAEDQAGPVDVEETQDQAQVSQGEVEEAQDSQGQFGQIQDPVQGQQGNLEEAQDQGIQGELEEGQDQGGIEDPAQESGVEDSFQEDQTLVEEAQDEAQKDDGQALIGLEIDEKGDEHTAQEGQDDIELVEDPVQADQGVIEATQDEDSQGQFEENTGQAQAGQGEVEEEKDQVQSQNDELEEVLDQGQVEGGQVQEKEETQAPDSQGQVEEAQGQGGVEGLVQGGQGEAEEVVQGQAYGGQDEFEEVQVQADQTVVEGHGEAEDQAQQGQHQDEEGQGHLEEAQGHAEGQDQDQGGQDQLEEAQDQAQEGQDQVEEDDLILID